MGAENRAQSAGMIHTQMRDTDSVLVPVQLHTASFSYRGEAMHIVGIKHESDEVQRNFETTPGHNVAFSAPGSAIPEHHPVSSSSQSSNDSSSVTESEEVIPQL